MKSSNPVNLVVSVLVPVCVIGILTSWIALNARLVVRDAVEENLATVRSTLTDLNAAIGYGGFIHNFKNHVLRPDERIYFDTSVSNLGDARNLIVRLDGLAAELGVHHNLDRLHATLNVYDRHLQRIDALVRNGLDARRIDHDVRVADGPALAALTEASIDIPKAYEARAAQISRQIRHLETLLTCLLTIVLLRISHRMRSLVVAPAE